LIIQLYCININGSSCYDDLIVDVIINLYSRPYNFMQCLYCDE